MVVNQAVMVTFGSVRRSYVWLQVYCNAYDEFAGELWKDGLFDRIKFALNQLASRSLVRNDSNLRAVGSSLRSLYLDPTQSVSIEAISIKCCYDVSHLDIIEVLKRAVSEYCCDNELDTRAKPRGANRHLRFKPGVVTDKAHEKWGDEIRHLRGLDGDRLYLPELTMGQDNVVRLIQ